MTAHAGPALEVSPQGRPSPNPNHDRLPRKYLVILLLCAATAALVTGLSLAASYRENLARWEERLTRVADANELLLANWLGERRWDAEQIAASPEIAAAFPATPGDRPAVPNQHADLNAILKLYPHYSAVYLFDLMGRPVATFGTPSVPASAIIQEALSGAGPKLVTLLASEDSPSFPRLALLFPVRARAGRAGGDRGVVGTLVLVTRPEALRSSLITDAASTQSGESLLTFRQGSQTWFISPLRYKREDASPTTPGQPGISAASGQRAIFYDSSDYRGVPVLAVTRFIPELGWGMVTKADRREVQERFSRTAILAVSLLCVFLAAFVGFAIAIWRERRIHGLEREIALRREAEEAFQTANRRLRALSGTNQAVVRAQDEGTLLNDVCRVLIEIGDYRLAWTGFAQRDDAKSVQVMAHAGSDQGYLSLANISWADTERGQSPAGVAIRTGQTVICRDTATDPAFAPWRMEALERGYASCIAVPLAGPDAPPFGALCVYSSRRDAFGQEEEHLLKEIAGDVSYGLMFLRARAERRQAEVRFELMASATNDALWDWDIVSDSMWRNEEFLRLFSTLEGPPGEKGMGSFGVLHPEDRERVISSIQEAFRTHAPSWSCEHRMRRHDGSYGEVSNRAAILFDANGMAIRMIGGVTDLTESKQAQRSAARLAAIVTLSHDAIQAVTLDGIITDWNEGATRLLGYTPEEAVGRSVAILIPPDQQGRLGDFLEKIRRGEGVFLETTSLRKDGVIIEISLSLSPIRDASGEIVGYSSVAHDLTKRRLAEKGMRRYNLLASRSRDIILFIRLADRRILEANAAAVAAYGYSREELLALTVADLHGAGGRKLTPEQLSDAHDHGVLFENIHRRKDGSEFPAETSTLGTMVDGEPTLISVIRDISERKRDEEARRWSSAQYEIILRTALDGFSVLDRQGRLLDLNETYCSQVGYSRDELLKMSVRDLQGVEGESDTAQHFQRIIEAGCNRFETKLRCKDGSLIDVEVSNTYSPREDRFYSFHRDITPQKEMLARVEQARVAADAANRAKSAFLANMSHEIRTPMNGILGMTELALRTELTAEQREYLTLAKSSADSLLALIDDILDFSKVEAGRLDFEAIEFNLRSSIETAVKTLAIRVQQKGLELNCRVGRDVPETLVGDPGRLRQIIFNLVGNAIKFTQHGEITIDIQQEAREPESTVLHFAVTDTGIGIPEDKQKAVFSAFTQADESISRRYGGSGLGLTISQRLVAMFGGRIWLESTVGKGSCFHFTARFGIGNQPIGHVVLPRMDFEGLPVLVVDDNHTNRRILEELLLGWRMRPTLAEGALAAFQYLDEAVAAGKPFALVLVDAAMPETDGFALVERINQASRMAVPAIMMLTSSGSRGDAARCRELGIAAYLTKPIGQSELLNAIIQVLGGKLAEVVQPTLITRHSIREQKRGLLILLAEDNRINQVIALGFLGKYGHRIEIAKNGREAVEKVRVGNYDLVLMDVQMPEMDGLEATALIREMEKTTRCHIPIIAMTAHALKGDRERCLESGMDGYISKPIKIEQLEEAIASVMHVGNEASTPIQPHPSSSAPAALDFDQILERLGGDEGLLDEVIGIFVDQAPRHLDALRQALAQGDAKAVEATAHNLKGELGYLGITKVAQKARELEELGRRHDLQPAAPTFSSLESDIVGIVAAMRHAAGGKSLAPSSEASDDIL